MAESKVFLLRLRGEWFRFKVVSATVCRKLVKLATFSALFFAANVYRAGQEMEIEKIFEICIVDISELRWTLASIYRLPQSDEYEFTGKLKTLIVTMQQTGSRVLR
jgi:hypothetical protein